MTASPITRDEAVSFVSTATAGVPSYWVSVGERVRGSASTNRGRQYEWDQMQAGTYSPTLINTDGALNPVNTSSPYAPNVQPRRPYRKRYQYPAGPQLLTGDQATMGEATPLAVGTLASAFGMGSGYDTLCAIVSSGSAFQGTQVLQATIPAASPTGHEVFFGWQWTMHPGQAHSFQGRVRVPGGAVSPTLHASLVWVDLTGTQITESAGTHTAITAGSATWISLSVTGTPPANAAGGYARITLDSASGAFTAQTDGWQVELAAAPSTWVVPGAWGNVFYGSMDRWPVSFDKAGTYMQTQPVVQDAFAVLSQTYPLPPFYEDVLASSPTFFFPLDDADGSAVFRELTGTFSPAPIANSPAGAGSLQPGQGASATVGFMGAPGPVVAFDNVDGASLVATELPGTFIELDSVGIQGPPVSGNWTRMFAFQAGAIPSNTGTLWSANQASWKVGGSILPGAVGAFLLGTNSAAPDQGKLAIELVTNSTVTLVETAGSVCDGNWHLCFLVSSGAGTLVQLYFDASPITIYSGGTAGVPLKALESDTLGQISLSGNLANYQGLQANMAHVAQWSSALTSTQIVNLSNSWRFGYLGERTGVRYARILAYAGWTGPTNIQIGSTANMGAATDIDGVTDAFSLLQNVVTTENGNHYVDAGGVIHFESRSARYDQLNPQWVFGNNVAAGELPFENQPTFDFDLDHVANQAMVSLTSTNQTFTSNVPSSQAQYGVLTLQRTINVEFPQEAADAAAYMAGRYAQPLLRVSSLTLRPSTSPAMWAVLAAGLEISSRVRVNYRTVGQAVTASVPAVQSDAFVEAIAWTVDPSTGDDLVVLQLSPADLNIYWLWAAMHTTLHAAATSGTATITCNPLPDSATNPAAASFAVGMQVTLDVGTASAETLTVASFGSTTAGYASFTITFTTNLAHNHAVNAVVCEAIPAGQTDPTVWDVASVLGSTTILAY